MADPSISERTELAPKDGENTLKRKRESDQEGESSSNTKELEGMKSPPAKIAAKSTEISSSPQTTEDKASTDHDKTDENIEASASDSGETAPQKQELDGQGSDKDGGVEKMQ
jgi:hypothetical protein